MAYKNKKMNKGGMNGLVDLSAPGNLPRQSMSKEYPHDNYSCNYNYPEDIEEMYDRQMKDKKTISAHMTKDFY